MEFTSLKAKKDQNTHILILPDLTVTTQLIS